MEWKGMHFVKWEICAHNEKIMYISVYVDTSCLMYKGDICRYVYTIALQR